MIRYHLLFRLCMHGASGIPGHLDILHARRGVAERTAQALRHKRGGLAGRDLGGVSEQRKQLLPLVCQRSLLLRSENIGAAFGAVLRRASRLPSASLSASVQSSCFDDNMHGRYWSSDQAHTTVQGRGSRDATTTHTSSAALTSAAEAVSGLSTLMASSEYAAQHARASSTPVMCWLWDGVRAPVRLTEVFSFETYACHPHMCHNMAGQC